MTLIVEDGTGRADADSYASAAQAQAYATQYGLTAAPGSITLEQALRPDTVAAYTRKSTGAKYLLTPQRP